MQKKVDPRFTQSDGVNVYTGNELLVKGALEAGVSLYSSYPGSPVAETLDVIRANAGLFLEHGIEAAIANNEALAAARINGSQALPLRAAAIMKCVGYNVALDVLETSNMAGANPGGGAVVIVGDDPTCSSTQAPADTRYKSRSIFMPVVMPATWQEIKDWVDKSFELSAASELYITYLVTTAQADGGGTVTLRPNRYPEISSRRKINLDTSQLDLQRRVMIPPASSRSEEHMLKHRLPKITETARKLGLDRMIALEEDKRRPVGFIAAGPGYLYVEDMLAELDLSGKAPVFKPGVVWPLDSAEVLRFARAVDNIVVVEEKGPFIEDQVKVILQDALASGSLDPGSLPVVIGKKFSDGTECLPAGRGLSPSLMITRLGGWLAELFDEQAAKINSEVRLTREVAEYKVTSPARSATFCAGCPHRDTGNVLMDVISDISREDYMRASHGGPRQDLVVHGDIGCYSMFNAIWDSRLMHDMSAMGQGLGAAAGLAPFVVNKRAVMIGDSTFFHTGLAGISDLARHRKDVLVFVLDNDTTAMTGQHPTPGNEVDLLGRPATAQKLERVIRGIVGPDVPVVVVDPEDEYAYRKTVEDLLMRDGLKVIIARKPCAIKQGRIDKQKLLQVIRNRGFLPTEQRINITEEVCEDCLECTRKTGCLGLERTETRLGRKVQIDPNSCVTDGACYRVEACPSFEEVIIRRRQPPPHRVETIELGELPEPSAPKLDYRWRSYICGFGGQGTNTVTAVLARAGMNQRYGVTLHNRKGMAIRNGSVKSVVVFSSPDEVTSPLIPEGKTDLVIGLDILEVARALDGSHHVSIGSPGYTSAVVSSAKNQTLETIQGVGDFEPDALRGEIARYLRPDGLVYEDVEQVAERFCGHSRYLNVLMLGLAWQKGWVPLSRANLMNALEATVPNGEEDTNRLAFELGRQLAVDRSVLIKPEPEPSLDEELADIARWMEQDPGGKKLAREFCNLFEKARGALDLEEAEMIGLAYRLEDVLAWGGPDYGAKYLDLVIRAHAAENAEEGFRATVALIHNLHRVMAVKDEVHVSHLLTCSRKLERDRARYDIDPGRGDRISYRHFTTPQFNLFGREFRIKLTTRQWMLRIVRHLKFLRRAMPGWHELELEFTGWYIDNVAVPFIGRSGDKPGYKAWVEAINAPETAKGYREVRYPGMEAAKQGVALLLKQAPDGDPAKIFSRDGAGDRRLPFEWKNPGKPGRRIGSHDKSRVGLKE
ncbi:MAG: indolepyruvate ferredoxin oxidoreductase [Candidatus Glassbacteria bacterium]|nr:indolepyruvate ferredoxin oxidoreductase [Candidatus Glassbacteria bacterium]